MNLVAGVQPDPTWPEPSGAVSPSGRTTRAVHVTGRAGAAPDARSTATRASPPGGQPERQPERVLPSLGTADRPAPPVAGGPRWPSNSILRRNGPAWSATAVCAGAARPRARSAARQVASSTAGKKEAGHRRWMVGPLPICSADSRDVIAASCPSPPIQWPQPPPAVGLWVPAEGAQQLRRRDEVRHCPPPAPDRRLSPPPGGQRRRCRPASRPARRPGTRRARPATPASRFTRAKPTSRLGGATTYRSPAGARRPARCPHRPDCPCWQGERGGHGAVPRHAAGNREAAGLEGGVRYAEAERVPRVVPEPWPKSVPGSWSKNLGWSPSATAPPGLKSPAADPRPRASHEGDGHSG